MNWAGIKTSEKEENLNHLKSLLSRQKLLDIHGFDDKFFFNAAHLVLGFLTFYPPGFGPGSKE